MSKATSPSPRIVVIGTSCAGKSTLARQLSDARGCTLVELDDLFWGEHWTPKPEAEFLQLVEAASAGQAWVASGNYGSARHMLWARATTMVWLNYSLPLVLWRGLKRTITRTVRGDVLFHGNRESFRRSFLSKESILWWIVSTHHRRRREFEALRASAQFAHLRWLEARHPAAAVDILRQLKSTV